LAQSFFFSLLLESGRFTVSHLWSDVFTISAGEILRHDGLSAFYPAALPPFFCLAAPPEILCDVKLFRILTTVFFDWKLSLPLASVSYSLWPGTTSFFLLVCHKRLFLSGNRPLFRLLFTCPFVQKRGIFSFPRPYDEHRRHSFFSFPPGSLPFLSGYR